MGNPGSHPLASQRCSSAVYLKRKSDLFLLANSSRKALSFGSICVQFGGDYSILTCYQQEVNKRMKGVVVAPQPRAAEIGARVLEAGGNAFDAALATAFMQTVLDPFMCSLGGMGSANIYVAATRDHCIVDFHTRAGSKVRADMWEKDIVGYTDIARCTLFDDYRSELGYSSIMTPGTVAGLGKIHRSYCTMKWGDLIAPAIKTAREGFQVPPYVVEFLMEYGRIIQNQPQQRGMPDGLTRVKATDACARIYLRKDGTLIQQSDLLINRDMANTLEILAEEGPDSFYRGSLARTMIRDLEANGSFITDEDLACYRPKKSDPLSTTYRGYTITSNQPPGGGPCIIELLNILEGFPLGELEHNGPEHLDILAHAMQLIHTDRNNYLGDPDFVSVPVDSIFLSKEHARKHQRAIREKSAKPPETLMREAGTTNLCVIDEAANIISMTHTIGSSSGVVTPGLGFMYNNSMKLFEPAPGKANSIAAGKARISALCPTIVFDGGRPVFAVGALGGSTIISSVVQSICNVIDWGMTAVEAVSAPRIHCEGAVIYVEAPIRSDTCEALRQLGHQVEHRLDSYPGGCYAIIPRAQLARIRSDGSLDGGADPRGGYGGVAYARG